MSRWRLFILLMSVLVMLAPTAGASITAQEQPDNCPVLVEQALQTLGSACQGLGRDQVCYGNYDVEANFWVSRSDLVFIQPSDRVGLIDLRTVAASPMDVAAQKWGLAVLNLQANLAEMAPGQAVTFLLMGDTVLQNEITPEQASQPIIAVPSSAANSTGLRRCPTDTAPVIGTTAAGSPLTVIGRSEANDWYEVWLPSGRNAWVRGEHVQEPTPGALAGLPVTYGQGIPPRCGAMQAFYFSTGVGVPVCREAPNAMVVQTPQDIEVAFNINGLDITVGSTVALTLAEAPDNTGAAQPALVLTLIEGELTAQFEQGGAARGPVGDTNAVECACMTKVQTQTPGTSFAVRLDANGFIDPNARLVPFQGDVGLVDAIMHGACDTANRTGLLSRAVMCDFDISFHQPCTASSVRGNVNQRSGPSTRFDSPDTLRAGEMVEVVGRTMGADGFEWLQLAGGAWPCAWVRSDVVNTNGTCENVPSVDIPLEPPPASVQPQPQPYPSSEPTDEPPQVEPVPGGTVEYWAAYDCRHLGENVFEWYEANVTFVNGSPVDAEILSGPHTGDWQPGCPTGIVCGDGICTEDWEDYASCPQDCSFCGDYICQPGETYLTCSFDCLSTCGDGVCEMGYPAFETYSWCPADCSVPVCGDGVCVPGEHFSTCPSDCGSTCGDGVCMPTESSSWCPADCP